MGGGGLWRRWQAAWRAFRQPPPQSRLDTLLEAVPAVIYARSAPPGSRLTYVSGNVRALLGYDTAEIFAEPGFWINRLHADDRERCLGTLRSLEQSGQVEMEYRLRAKDGTWRWLHDECRVVRDATGACVEIVGSCLDVSGRHRSEQALARSEAELRAAQSRLVDALESSDDGFSVFDADDRLVAFNSRYLGIYPTIADIIRPGVKFEELLRVSAQRGQYRGVPPEQVERWVRERLECHRHPAGAFEQLLGDGRWLEIVERPTAEGGRVAIRREITERKSFEAALRDELRFKQTLIDALPFPVFYKNTKLVYLGCNGAFAKALGRPTEEIVGKTLLETHPPEKAAEFSRRDHELLSRGGVQHYETTFRWGDGSMRRIAVVKATFNGPDGTVAGLIGTIIDQTQQKLAEEKLVQTAKLATLGQIASEVAHELNQPLSILRMTAENGADRLSHGELDGEATAAKLSTIIEQAGRLAEMIARLRSFVRDAHEERRPFAPTGPIRAATEALRQQFVLDDIVLAVDLPEHCPDLVGQPSQMEQVILALLSNARDAVVAHHPPGRRHVAVRLHVADDKLVLTVRDNGGGIAADLWPRVFTPFFTTKAEDAGTGLGLSASANIIAAMGGHLDGTNVGDGAEFRAIWPLAASESAAAPPSPAAPPERRRILVVDDEPLAVECLTDFLTARGYEVVAAVSPLDALDFARATAFDLVLTDQRMPGMDGNVLISRLRALQPGLPAIMMSGGAMPLPAAADGPVARLSKPLVLDELGRTLDSVLSSDPAQPAPPTTDETVQPMAAGNETVPPMAAGNETVPPMAAVAPPAQRLWLMGELTAHLAHDFGQPLNIIRLNAENLLDTLADKHPGDDRLRRALTSTVDQCRRMQDLAQSLVATTRRPGSPPRRLSVVAVLRRALSAFQDNVRMQAIALRWHATLDLPAVDGHPHRLEAALRHLLDNACQALAAEAVARHAQTPPWQPRLDVECGPGADGGVAIRIADNGPGIPAAARRAALAGTGSGLGLSIALGVMAEMGGGLDFADTGVPGTDIRIHLPAARRRVYLAGQAGPLAAAPWWRTVDRPDDAELAVLVMDWPDLPPALAELHRACPDLAVLVVADLDVEQSRRAVAAGAMLVLPAGTSAEELLTCADECLNNNADG